MGKMGGPGIATDKREAASALRWWLEAGVDVAIQEDPRNWLEQGPALTPDQASQAPPPPLPESLGAFQRWLSTSADAPLASPRAKPVQPQGLEGAEVMVLSEPPGREELVGGKPVGGTAAELLDRMLAAIGMEGTAYVANLACFHSAGRLSPQQLEHCASAARWHVALARPKRLLLVGDLPARALLGKPLLEARGHIHKIEGVRTVATIHPRQLLKRPSDKALAWKDLLLLAEETM